MGSCFSTQSNAGPERFMHLARRPSGCLHNELFWGCPAGGDTEGWGMYNIYGSDAGGITSPIQPCKTLEFLWKKWAKI